MDDDRGRVAGKVMGSLGISFLAFIIYVVVNFFIDFDNECIIAITFIGLISLSITMILKIFSVISIKSTFIATLAILLPLIMAITYYDSFSMNIEPLIHLHNKYGIAYSEMVIIRTTKSTAPFLFSRGTSRSATIKYGKTDIYVYYNENHLRESIGWIDDY